MTYPTGPIVSQQDVSEMQRLLNVLAGKEEPAPTTSNSPQRVNETRRASGNPDADAMKNILESFYGASGEAYSSLQEEAAFDPALREAMQTRVTPTGVQIGQWEVRANLLEGSKSRKEYAVANPTSGEVVFEKLAVYEAAHAIVRYLNRGEAIDGRRIQEVVSLEEQFFRNRQDAGRFKKRFARCIELGEQQAADVFEARYQTARANALAAQDQIQSVLDSIR